MHYSKRHISLSGATAADRWLRHVYQMMVLCLLAGCLMGLSADAAERTQFDHLTTGFELVGQHRDLPCESCHVNAIFKGTSRDCSACHGVGTAVRATAKPVNHILSSNRCDSCHTPLVWKPAVNFDHAEVRGSCSSCHNNVQAQGKGPTHMDTDLECDACHSTLSWSGALGMPGNHIPLPAADANQCGLCHLNGADYSTAVMNHINISSNCAQCHAAGLAFANMAPPELKVLPDNHLPTNGAACESCHSSSNFASFAGTTMNHTPVSSIPCATCHASGLSFVGAPPIVTEPANHIPVGTTDCGSCHSKTIFTTFSGTAMNHTGFTTNCITCHGAGSSFVGAPPVKTIPANHIPTGSIACEGCHSTTNFTTFIMPNVGSSMNHAVVAAITCSSCHEKGLSFVGAPLTVARPALKANGSAHVASGECNTCHFNTTSFVGATDYPTNHIPLPNGGATNCNSCHSNAGDYSIYAMDHTVVTGTSCTTCHGAGKSFTNMSPPVLKVLPTNHIPVGATACESCHSPSNFTAFSGTAMNHAVVSATTCATCHASGLSFVGSPAVVTETTNHIPVGATACDNCHSKTNFTTFSGTAMNHTGFGANCASCHANGLTFAGAPPVKTMPSNHVPTGTIACEGCHAATNFTTFVMPNTGASMNHAVVTAIACSSCHEKGLSFVGAPPTVLRPALKASGAAHAATGECNTCHFNTTSFKGATDYPANHIPLPNGAATNCNSCHSNAANFSIYVMDHSVVSGTTCTTCHGAGKSFTNMAPPVLKILPGNHIPVAAMACESCHSPGNFTSFAGTAMNHAVVSATACSACHARGLTFVGPPTVVTEPANHIPIGTTACDSCHSKTNFTTFSGTVMNHTGFGTNCIACHGAGLTFVGSPPVKTIPGNHIPTGSIACEGCHSASNFTSFVMPNTGTSMNHAVVTSIACSTCHEKGLSFVGTPATVLRPVLKANGSAHVTGGECNTCHFNTTSFRGASDLPANHIPLPAADNNNCVLCHTTGNYSVAVMNHVNIANNCAQCHAYGLSFANMAPPTLVQPPAGATGHIPSNPPNGSTALACEQCHSATVFTNFAGTKMIHAVVRGMTCKSCHELGMKWKTNTGVRLWVRPSNHHGTQDCGGSGCHSTRDKFVSRPVALRAQLRAAGPDAAAPSLGNAAALSNRLGGFDHRRALAGSCISCHDQASGIGKPVNHISTSNSCEACHTVNTWLPVRSLDHTQVKGSCVSCHNGSTAPGKSSSHILSNNSCESCHTTNAWLPAHFDHAGINTTCMSCHDSVHTIGKPVNHVPTTQDCSSCHGTLAWKPARLDHTQLTATCATCHNNVIATGVITGHMSTQRDCANCHRYPDWSVSIFVHDAVNYPGDHAVALTCLSCHTTNTDQIVYSSPADTGSCAGCHAKDFKVDLHPKTVAGAKYGASELKNCAGACHVYSDDSLTKIVQSIPGPYHKVTDASFKH
jgi:Cytochrome c7 and related cytochrome c